MAIEETQPVRRLFDFSVNIPTLILIFSTLIGVITTWVHMDDAVSNLAAEVHAQEKQTERLNKNSEAVKTNLVILKARLHAYPLHRHVGDQIIYDNSPGPGDEEMQTAEK